MIRIDFKTISLVAALAATACSPEAPTPVETASSGAASSGAPAPVAGYDWNFVSHDGQSRLVYGMANSDASVIGLSCTDGSGRVELFTDVEASDPAEFHLESGGDTERYAAESEPSAMTGGQYLTAAAGTSEPVLRRFRDTGWLAVWRGDQRAVLVSNPDASENVGLFFAACG